MTTEQAVRVRNFRFKAVSISKPVARLFLKRLVPRCRPNPPSSFPQLWSIALVFLFLAGCAHPELRAYNATETIADCEAYLQRFPQGDHRQFVAEKLEMLRFEEAVRIDKPEAYAAFQKHYASISPSFNIEPACFRAAWESQSRLALQAYFDRFGMDSYWYQHGKQVLERLEQFDYEALRRKRDLAGVRQFLEKYPEGKHTTEVNTWYEEIVFAEAKLAGSSAALEAYLAAFPKGRFAEEATGLLEPARFAALKENPTLKGCMQYISTYPQGPHAKEVSKIARPLMIEEEFDLGIKCGTICRLQLLVSDHPGHPRAAAVKKLLQQRALEVSRQFREVLKVSSAQLLSSPGKCELSIETVAEAKVRHTAFEGDYLGFILDGNPLLISSLTFDANTYLDYGNGQKSPHWIIWFPDRDELIDAVIGTDGTAISVAIDMPGLKGGGAATASSAGGLYMGYGSMLFSVGSTSVRPNMAYCSANPDSGKTGSLRVELLSSFYGYSRAVVLFPWSGKTPRAISLAGYVFRMGAGAFF